MLRRMQRRGRHMSSRLFRNATCGVLATTVHAACGGQTEPTSTSAVETDAATTEKCPTEATGCALPAGLECPTAMSPQLLGWSPPVDRACVGDGDCVSVAFETSAAGNTFALGVNTASVSAAKAAAAVCRSGFRLSARPADAQLAETGIPDSGLYFGQPIEAYCAAGTCKTRYR